MQIEQISKLYRIGTRRRRRYRTLRESLSAAMTGPWRKLQASTSWRANGQAVSEARPDTIWALKDVSFDVGQGEVVGIVGRNGAGKSTLLKILSRITEPTSGEVKLHGRVGSLLEVGTGFHQELTGRENIYLNGAILGMTRQEIARKFDEIVAFAEIEQFLDTPVKRYSSGMYVRLAFAVAAHLEPEILIVDEVLAVGDMEFQKKCLGKMGQVAQSGRTVLFVSHNMAIVQNLCDRAVLLTRGRVEVIGECSEVLTAYLRSGSSTDPERLPLSSYRKPDMMPIMRDITLRNAQGQATDHFYAGSELIIDVHYDSPVPLNNPVFGVFLLGGMGEKLCHLQTLSQHGPIPSLPQRGIVRCLLPELPLVPGTYMLSFNCSSLHTEGSLDFLARPLAFHVEAADYFGTGHLPPARNGSFLLKAEWSFLPQER